MTDLLPPSSPAIQMMRLINGYQVSQALHVAATLGIADLLWDGPRSSDALAELSLDSALPDNRGAILGRAIGGEMEGAGVAAAAARTKTEWILVKAVCDWADGQKHDGYQEMAAAASASLVHAVLSEPDALHGLTPPPT